MPILSRITSLLASRRIVLLAGIVAALLTLPSLRVGWIMDDYFHQLALYPRNLFPEWQRSRLDLFRFLNGDPAYAHQLMDAGFVPWWTWPGIRAGFWRPVTALTHWLDYQLWPSTPELMHLQSIAWFGLLAGAVAVLYRRIMGPVWIAGLAALMYAVDDARGLPVGWLANRNAVLAALFGVLAVISHDRWRTRGVRWAGAGACLLLTLSLLSAEAGVATCAYLFAYAVFLEDGAWRRRVASLLPYLMVIVVWRMAWNWQGYGADGLGLYADPIRQPGRFLGFVAGNAPLLLLGQWALPPSDVTIFLRPESVRWLWLAALIVLTGLAVLLAPAVRRSRTGRFWACGMLLSVLPISATFPSDRLLFFVGLGAMGLLAMFLETVPVSLRFRRATEESTESADPPAGCRSPAEWGRFRSDAPGFAGSRRWVVVPAWLLVVVHLAVAPAGLALRSAFPAGPDSAVEALQIRTPLDAGVAEQDLIIVNAPSTAHALYLPVMRTLVGKPIPRHTRVLAPAVPSVTIHRPDERTLVVRPERGYLDFQFDRLFRSEDHPMVVGQRVELTGMTVEVSATTADGRPAEAVFRFDKRLEDPSLRWLKYRGREFVTFTPPDAGETITLPASWPW